MNAGRDVERLISSWLVDEAAIGAPDRVLESTRHIVERTSQRRFAAGWRDPVNLSIARISAIAATLLVVVGAGILVSGLMAPPGIGGSVTPAPPSAAPTVAPPSPTAAAISDPTPRPTDNLNTATWLPFTSARYGLTMSYPTGWNDNPSTLPWDLVTDQSPAMFPNSIDHLDTPGSAAVFAAYGMALPDGMTFDAFVAAYQAPNIAQASPDACFPPPSEWEPITIDGRAAGINNAAGRNQGCDFTEVMLLADGYVYIFSGYRDLAIDRPLFDAFLSTIRLKPAAAVRS